MSIISESTASLLRERTMPPINMTGKVMLTLRRKYTLSLSRSTSSIVLESNAEGPIRENCENESLFIFRNILNFRFFEKLTTIPAISLADKR